MQVVTLASMAGLLAAYCILHATCWLVVVGLLAGNGRDVGQVARNRLLGLGMIQNRNGTHSLRHDWR